MKLRHYQNEAVAKVYEYLRNHDDNPCVVIPTGGGKTPVIAQICRDSVDTWQGRVLILAHVKELLEQSVAHLNRLLDWNKVGIYSAGLKSRDTQHPVIVASIQSVYRRAEELGKFDLVIVDEAHLIPPDGEGRYRTYLKEACAINPLLRVIGMTATPYRMTSGMICAPANILNNVCYEVGVKALIRDGYLCQLRSKRSKKVIDTTSLHIRGGEFIDSENEEIFGQEDVVEMATDQIVEYMFDRHSCLVFCSGIQHAEDVAEKLREKTGDRVEAVFGTTSAADRQKAVEEFRSGELRYLVNVGVYTLGFDAPNVDCVAILRATMSPGLFYQMCGRGFRLHDSKQDCLILDYGNNVSRHGPIDSIRARSHGGGSGKGEPGVTPTKTCTECLSIVLAAYTRCPDCGHEFPKPDPNHDGHASDAGILSGEVTVKEYQVHDIQYFVHTKKGADENAPKTMRVQYRVGFGYGDMESEWICFEHTGWAKEKAKSWWLQRAKEPEEGVPASVAEAVSLAPYVLKEPSTIHVRSKEGERFNRIVGYDFADELEDPSDEWGDAREPEGDGGRAAALAALEDIDDDAVPF